MHKPSDAPDPEADGRAGAADLEPVDAGALDAEAASRSASRDAAREALDRAWREQEAYTRTVAEIREPRERRAARRAAAIAAAVLAVAAALGYLAYDALRPAPAPVSEDAALRMAAEARQRREEEARAKLAAEAAEAEAAKEGARAADEAKRAVQKAEERAEERAAARAQKARDEAERRNAELAAQTQAMVQAEERARALSAAAVKEAPRAAPRPGTVFQDCADCPRMVVVPAGEFTMGSPAAEAGRGLDEGPQRAVTIAQPFALGRSEVTVAEFRRFVEETGYRTDAERDARAQGCAGFVYADPGAAPSAPLVTSWRNPGLAQAQADSHPVLCVSWNDARAYAQWLSKKTGKRYRLPSEAEWEYAARAGSAAARPWGEDPAQACRYANVADQSRFQTFGFGQKHECTDGHYFTAPAGGYLPNRFGLYDMIGNVWEWTEDCWNASYAGAPADGGARLGGDCTQRVLRGGSWSTAPNFARSATRHKNAADFRDNLSGFRLARSLD